MPKKGGKTKKKGKKGEKAKKKIIMEGGCCEPMDENACGCSVESMITVDGKGQMVLPKEVREKTGIKAGDKLAVVCMGKRDKSSFILMLKSEEFSGLIKILVGPAMKDFMGE